MVHLCMAELTLTRGSSQTWIAVGRPPTLTITTGHHQHLPGVFLIETSINKPFDSLISCESTWKICVENLVFEISRSKCWPLTDVVI